jgi:hypothetical protein
MAEEMTLLVSNRRRQGVVQGAVQDGTRYRHRSRQEDQLDNQVFIG